ncbi:hypothetical protein MA16_Dca028440 [Dendrobium catenatum]|uniref:Uncharacterized protein n=1 Tax=Dendrobium catenatum TaxID=906689 RepID=A0A2I0VEN8_9ASPA|nr:hypothetical protein MA16_Dca028440 [Dendrobium catenatum]
MDRNSPSSLDSDIKTQEKSFSFSPLVFARRQSRLLCIFRTALSYTRIGEPSNSNLRTVQPSPCSSSHNPGGLPMQFANLLPPLKF